MTRNEFLFDFASLQNRFILSACFKCDTQTRAQLHAEISCAVSHFGDKNAFHIARINFVVSLHVAVSLFRY